MQEYSATKIQEKLVAYSDKRPFMKIMGMHFWGVYCHNWAPDCVCVCVEGMGPLSNELSPLLSA